MSLSSDQSVGRERVAVTVPGPIKGQRLLVLCFVFCILYFAFCTVPVGVRTVIPGSWNNAARAAFVLFAGAADRSIAAVALSNAAVHT